MEVSLVDIDNRIFEKKALNDLPVVDTTRLRIYFSVYAPEYKYSKHLSVSVFKKLKYNFNNLKYFVLYKGALKSKEYAIVLKILEICTPNLRLVRFRECFLKPGLISALHLLAKSKAEADKPINIQIYRIYVEDFYKTKLSVTKAGYLLSLTSRYCKNIFHTQTCGQTNQDLLHFFLWAADFTGRKSSNKYISLGACHYVHADTFVDIAKLVRVWTNPKDCYRDLIKQCKTEFLELNDLRKFFRD